MSIDLSAHFVQSLTAKAVTTSYCTYMDLTIHTPQGDMEICLFAQGKDKRFHEIADTICEVFRTKPRLNPVEKIQLEASYDDDEIPF